VGDAVDANGCSLPKDADGDGVTDDRDQCANTPAGAKVDANGCSDQDNDTVMDPSDRCPNTPAGAKVDANGCPTDQDKDGVFDGLDQCADTPAGTPVDAKGCPMDSDGDGVTDNNDRCPNTPAGTQVDALGCPVLFEAGKATLVLQGVTFATNKAILTPESMEILDRVAERIINFAPSMGGGHIEVGGHTDNTGTRRINAPLSQARADAVKAYLVSKGVPADLLTTKGYGPDRPVDTNATVEGRANNRRVELKRTE
jgi:outer membrane protein OmpA-like peptidoglycan-associated protein